MNRFFLILPILVTASEVVTWADPAPPKLAPRPKVVVPPASKAPTPLKAPVKPKVVVPPGVKVPQVKPPRIKPPATSHDHEGADSDKPVDPVGDSLDFLWKQSDVAFHEGDYPTAVKIHRAIVTLDPTDTESFGVAAWLLWSMGQKSEARAFISQGLDANPKDAEMWNVAGEHYDLEKSYADAKNAYAKSVELSGAKAPEMLRRRLAHSAEHAGDLELSEQTWTNLVRDFPNEAVDKNNLARVKALRNPVTPVAPVE
ncbi:hypothetical protein IAD21_02060 [Abditibacteriota bacterium]|nr:hypothetical protein IAD21_02060 [Abditibacteriota bacterium]